MTVCLLRIVGKNRYPRNPVPGFFLGKTQKNTQNSEKYCEGYVFWTIRKSTQNLILVKMLVKILSKSGKLWWKILNIRKKYWWDLKKRRRRGPNKILLEKYWIGTTLKIRKIVVEKFGKIPRIQTSTPAGFGKILEIRKKYFSKIRKNTQNSENTPENSEKYSSRIRKNTVKN